MLYEDIFSVPIIKKAYKSHRISFFLRKLKYTKFHMRAKFRCRAFVGR